MIPSDPVDCSVPMPEPLRPADRFVTALVILCTCTGFLAGALFATLVS